MINSTKPISKRLAKKIAALKGKLLLRAPGIIKDSRGTKYTVNRCGSVVRLTERPWNGKSERREVILQRRIDRGFKVEAI